MTKLYIDSDIVYTLELASGAADTTVTTSGTGTSLINTSAGGQHILNSVTAGANVTITDDNAGNLTIAATEDNLSNNTTSDLAEGTNQYFTDARVMTSLETVSGDIIPDADNTRSLGSATKEWKEVFIGPGSLYIDGHKVLGSDDTDTINFSTDTGQTMDFFAGGTTGTAGVINMASRGNVTSFNDTLLHLGPQAGGNTVRAHGTLEAPDLHVGNLEFSANKIDSTASNGNLEIATDGTGYLHLNVADVYIGSPITSAVKIDESSITTTAGNLTIGAFGTVDIAGHYTSAETDSAISTATAALVDSAPAALDTLNELASALGDDANFSTTVTNSIATKMPLAGGAFTGAVTTNSTFDGRDVATDGTKLDGIEASATADQTDAEIRAAVEAASDSNVFTDADHTKLDGIETGATADQSAAEILTLIKTVDGAGSGLDADTLDGNSSAYFTGYTDTAIANLSDSAPGTLDTLNELAAALGDDANFSTTVTNSIGTKWTQDNTKISQWDTAYGWGNHATPGYITDYTVTQSDVTGHQAALTITQSQISDLTHFDGAYASLTGKPTIPSNNNELTNGAGYITTYDPTESDITQHQAALSITESQISDLSHYTNANAIAAVEGEATLDLTGDVTVGATKTLQVGGLNMSTSAFTQAANTALNLTTSGAGGHFNLTTDDAMYLGNSSAYMTIKPTLIESTGATLAVTGNLTGDVTGNVDAPTTVSVGSLDITTNNITQSTADQPVNITTSGSNAYINATAPSLFLGTSATNFLTLTPSKISTNTSGSTRLEIEAGHLAANPANRTFPSLTNWESYDIQASTDNGLFTQADHQAGYPIFAAARTDAVAESQATAAYLVNSMQYDHHDQNGNMDGSGVEVRFGSQDEAGNLHELGANLVKMRNVTTGGSAGSSTITAYDGEYTLTLGKYNDGGLNAITVNKDFGQHTKEIRICNTPRDSGTTVLSGLYLTYDGAETGTPSAILQLRDEDDDTNTENIKLEQDRTTLGTVGKMHSLSADPSSAEAGDFYFNSSTGKFRGYNGSNWVNFHG